MVTVMGAVLFSTQSRLLSAGSAAVFAGIDVYHVWRRAISPVYLVDAAVQGVCLALWAGRH
jgi:hypothetical protein